MAILIQYREAKIDVWSAMCRIATLFLGQGNHELIMIFLFKNVFWGNLENIQLKTIILNYANLALSYLSPNYSINKHDKTKNHKKMY